MRYDCIVWDWNGTLLDDVHLCVTVFGQTLARRGLPKMDLAQYRHIMRFPVRLFYQDAGLDLNAERFEDMAKEYIEDYMPKSLEIDLVPGALTVLKQLREMDIHQVVISASDASNLKLQIAHYGVQELVDEVWGLCDIYANSKVELSCQWISQSGLDPARVLMVGDTLHDAQVARAMGSDCVLVCTGHQSEQILSQAGVPVMKSLEQVILYAEDLGTDDHSPNVPLQ